MGRIEPDVLGRLFDEHAAALALAARQWCDSPEDVAQEAFIQLARQKAIPERVVPWLAEDGTICFHDVTCFEGVSRVVGEALATGQWMIAGLVDSLLWIRRPKWHG